MLVPDPLTLSDDWRDLGTLYTGLGACANVEVTVVAGVGRVKWRDSVREALTSATYTYLTECRWLDVWGDILHNCGQPGDICQGNAVIANCDEDGSRAAAKPIGGVTFCGRNQLQKNFASYRQTARICITP